MAQICIKIQTACFQIQEEEAAIADGRNGATVLFVGRVRGDAAGQLQGLSLEHYSPLTEQSLQCIIEDACARWSLSAVTLIHRIGYLSIGEPIVLLAVASAHRADAFLASEYVMDLLKTQSPFWKKEYYTGDRAAWVDAKDSDVAAAVRWVSSEG